MPTRPAQPAEVSGCAGPAVDQAQRSAEAESKKKGGAKGAGSKRATKKGSVTNSTAKGAAAADSFEPQLDAWPSGISEQDEVPPTVQGAWPSGISEK